MKTGQFPFSINGRALGIDEPAGFVKMVADAATDRVLGVHIIHAHASDLIQEGVTTMEFAGAAEDIARIVHGHPTLSEVVQRSGARRGQAIAEHVGGTGIATAENALDPIPQTTLPRLRTRSTQTSELLPARRIGSCVRLGDVHPANASSGRSASSPDRSSGTASAARRLRSDAAVQRLSVFEELEDYRQYRAGQDQPPGDQPGRGAQAAARHVHLGRGGARQVAHDGRLLQGVAPPAQAPRALPRVHARDPRADARAPGPGGSARRDLDRDRARAAPALLRRVPRERHRRRDDPRAPARAA